MKQKNDFKFQSLKENLSMRIISLFSCKEQHCSVLFFIIKKHRLLVYPATHLNNLVFFLKTPTIL
jgi:hypothetical protein